MVEYRLKWTMRVELRIEGRLSGFAFAAFAGSSAAADRSRCRRVGSVQSREIRDPRGRRSTAW